MTAPVDHETVPRSGAQSDATSRAPANRGLASLSDAGLTFLESGASRRSGAFRSPAKRLFAVVGSQRRPAVQLERSARDATVGALGQRLEFLVGSAASFSHCLACRADTPATSNRSAFVEPRSVIAGGCLSVLLLRRRSSFADSAPTLRVNWLARVRGPDSKYAPLHVFPRPRRAATRVVGTEYELPRVLMSARDVAGDSKGNIWFSKPPCVLSPASPQAAG